MKALDSLKEFLKSTEKNLQVSLIKSKIDDPIEWQIDCSTRTLNELSLVDFLKGMSNRTAAAKNQIKELEEERRILPFTDKVLKKKEYDIKKKEIQFESKNFEISPNTKVLVDGKNVVNLSEMATAEYWLNGFEKIKDKLIDGAYELANAAIMGTAQIASAWFSGSLTKSGNDSATLKLSEDFSNPITVLRNREPDFFSNMYNMYLTKDFGTKTEMFWATRIEGIDIPTAKRSTTKRNFCGREIEVVGSEVELNKICTLKFAVDQECYCFYENAPEINAQTRMNHSRNVGLLYNFLHDYERKENNLIIEYNSLYTAISEDSNGKVHYNFKKDKNSSTTDLYEKLDDKYKNRFMFIDRYFVFEDVKFIAQNSTDLEYDSQSANEMTGEMKFIYKRVVESKI